jgi:Sugar kinases, ribokinase family
MTPFTIKSRENCRWDFISLGEVMLRFDPENERIHNTRNFRVWEGGGEYNVARNLSKVFRLNSAIVTALADNQVGRLVEDMITGGCVDVSQIVWRETDSLSRKSRNGFYFYERGFGPREPSGCSDRGNTAVSQLKPGEIDWDRIFDEYGVRWFHTGGIFAGLSESTPAVALEAMRAAKAQGTIVSYDLNYRASLWAERGGLNAANAVNRELMALADVVFGVEGFDASFDAYDENVFRDAATDVTSRFPNIKLLATTLRGVRSASRHDLSAACFSNEAVFKAPDLTSVEVLDRVGSGDAFAAGLIYGVLCGDDVDTLLRRGLACAALTMSTIGDGSAATLAEVEDAMAAEKTGIKR